MSRQLRLEYDGACYHIMNRGLERTNIFLSDRNKNLFLDLLSEISERFKVDIHSYCLMDNHYHLLVQTKLSNLNSAMRYLSSVYTQRFNRDVKRDGPLFRGRYKSILIDKESYLLNVSRYIHKNPSAAKIIADDQQFPWSSYQYYNLKKLKKPKWVVTKEVLKYFDGDGKKYEGFVELGVDKYTSEFYSNKKTKAIIGKKSFIKEISDKFLKDLGSKEISNGSQITIIQYPSLKDLLFKVARECGIDSTIILDKKIKEHSFERNLLIYIISLNPRYSMVEKGKFLGITGGAVSKSSKRFLNKIRMNEIFQD